MFWIILLFTNLPVFSMDVEGRSKPKFGKNIRPQKNRYRDRFRNKPPKEGELVAFIDEYLKKLNLNNSYHYHAPFLLVF